MQVILLSGGIVAEIDNQGNQIMLKTVISAAVSEEVRASKKRDNTKKATATGMEATATGMEATATEMEAIKEGTNKIDTKAVEVEEMVIKEDKIIASSHVMMGIKEEDTK